MNILEIKNLSLKISDKKILDNINFTLKEKEIISIIGQSGSGKTVFLKSLLGLFTPDSGDIIYDGVKYADMKRKEQVALRQKMGMVFQGSALFDSMTVLENVMFPLKMFSQKSADEIRERADIVLSRVNLVNAENKLPSEISGGMQKRVAIARAIVNNPNYLFCDEPNSGLDPKTSIVIDNLIQEITQEFNITTVINTHDMNSVMEIGAKIVFLKNGYKEWEGSKDTIFRTDNEAVTDFVYSSELFKKVRKAYLEEHV